MPPDRSPGIMSRAPRRPTAWSFISTIAPQELLGQVEFSRRENAMFSNTGHVAEHRPEFWNIIPISRRSA